MTIEPGLIVLAACLLLGGGFALGRQTGPARARFRELRAKLETEHKELELAQASLDAAKVEIARIRGEHEDYRGRVVDHFNGTSELMRDLTLQYRALYDELTRGAIGLCPEGSVGLQQGFQPESLAPGSPGDPAGSDPAADR